MKIIKILLVSFLLSSTCYSQTVNLDRIEVSIGDSLEQVIKNFSNPIYHLQFDTLQNSIRCRVFKEVEKSNISTQQPVKLLAYLHFIYFGQIFESHHTKELYEIEKVWNNLYLTEASNLLNAINNIIEKNSIDKYSSDLYYNKTVEPDYSSKIISIKLNSFTNLEIYSRSDNYYEINEVISEDQYKFPPKEYVLIFEDFNHYYGEEEYIFEVFKKEEDAERRKRELLIKYLSLETERPEIKILRFHKDMFNFDK